MRDYRSDRGGLAIIAVCAVVIVLLVSLAACAPQGPKSGTVIDKRHEQPYSYWVSGIDTPAICTPIGTSGQQSCNPGIHVPGHMEYVPESWSLKLDDGKHSGWRDVGQSTYERCSRNEYCDTNQ